MSASAGSKRQSLLPPVAQAGPKPPVHFSSSLTIADSAILVGSHKISISSESIVHPRAKLDSRVAPVAIGRRCIIHERTHIGSASVGPSSTSHVEADQAKGVTLGDYVTVEAGAVLEAGGTSIGDGSVIGVGSTVGSGAQIGKYCTLSPHSIVAANEIVSDYTVLLSDALRRQDRRDLPDVRHRAQALQISVLRNLIPSHPVKFQ